MSTRKLIGKVSATEKYPSSCDEFQFWLSDDAILSPFDIVLVENATDDSITYGVVQDIFHITDGTGHISNYVSSDFGNVQAVPMTRRLSLSYAKVSVVHNTNENFMPVFEGSAVYTANEEDIQVALGLNTIDDKTAIPAGIMKAGNNVSVPINYNSDFLIGPEGAHVNISGISGLATKTSYIMFLLKAIQHICMNDVAIIVMNVKGDDLLHIHKPNEKITDLQRQDWDDLGIPCAPFENVKYLYPYRKQKDKLYANTSLPIEDLTEQFAMNQAANFVYTFEHDINKLYSRSLSTGMQERTRNKDYVRDVEFTYQEASDGKPLYIGWLAVTDFSGIISDESVQGIRFRKGNILVGNSATFAKFFPTTEREGQVANRMFAGEIHVLHDKLIPNSQRDDFEPSAIYNEMKKSLSTWAGSINKKYRRGTSEANSALRNLTKLNAEQKELEEKIDSGAITSDEKREQIAERLDKISRTREAEERKVRRALERGTFDDERREAVEKTLSQTETAVKKVTTLSTKIIKAGYATKNDLPSSYSRDERKLYQRIISVIDAYFVDSPRVAEELREKIKIELSEKKK